MSSKYPHHLLYPLSILYSERKTPVDTIPTLPNAAQSFSKELKSRFSIDLSPQEVIGALMYFRKSGVLPRLKRKQSEWKS